MNIKEFFNNNSTLIKIISIVLLLFFGYFSNKMLGKDSAVEQVTESVIKQTTGADVDFSAKDK